MAISILCLGSQDIIFMATPSRNKIASTPGQNTSKTQFWRDHVDTWRRSGQTQRGYAKQQGLAIPRFVYWKNKFYPNTPLKAKDFVPVQITTTQSPVRLIHPNGVTIECPAGTDVSWLRSLLWLNS